MSILNIQNVDFSYRKNIPVLSDISFPIERGDFLVLLGPNGSGKTTLMGIMSGVLSPDSGIVFLNGNPIGKIKRREIARKISYLPQNISIDFPFTVRQIVLMGRFAYMKGLGIECQDDIEASDRAMELTGVLRLAERMIHQLSGGELRRVFLAQAIAAEPEIMMLDEPISSLDIKYKVQILDLLDYLNRERGITIIATLHDLNMASQYAGRLLLLKEGKVAALGKASEILTPEQIKKIYDVDVDIINEVERKFIIVKSRRAAGFFPENSN